MIAQLSEIVRIAGKQLMRLRNEGMIEGKWEGTQFKAKADILMHNLIVNLLTELDSTIPIVSEEDTTVFSALENDRYWIVDPIDGTASFVHGYSGFVTQIGLMVNSEPYMAAIYAPALELLYLAERGRGAFLNNEKLCLNPNNKLNTLIDNYPEPRGIAYEIYEGLQLKKYIECGGISLKMCKVADSSADLFVKDVIVRDWDIAPPQLVLEEAGGIMRDINGEIIRYNGDNQHRGIVATSSERTYKQFCVWLNRKGEGDEL